MKKEFKFNYLSKTDFFVSIIMNIIFIIFLLYKIPKYTFFILFLSIIFLILISLLYKNKKIIIKEDKLIYINMFNRRKEYLIDEIKYEKKDTLYRRTKYTSDISKVIYLYFDDKKIEISEKRDFIFEHEFKEFEKYVNKYINKYIEKISDNNYYKVKIPFGVKFFYFILFMPVIIIIFYILLAVIWCYIEYGMNILNILLSILTLCIIFILSKSIFNLFLLTIYYNDKDFYIKNIFSKKTYLYTDIVDIKLKKWFFCDTDRIHSEYIYIYLNDKKRIKITRFFNKYYDFIEKIQDNLKFNK